jgi:hypothetical protein
MMKLKYGPALAAGIVTTFAYAAFDGFTIKPSPKVGDVHKYRQSGKFDLNGKQYDFTSLSTQRVVKVETSGSYVIREDVTESKVNGADIPEGQGAQSSSTTYSARGEVIQIEGSNVDDSVYRFANLGVFIAPDKAVGLKESWSHDLKENKTTGAVAGIATFTLVGEDKVGSIEALKIVFSIKETANGGASSDGTVWISKADSTLLKLTAKWINVPISGTTISGDFNIALVR